MREEHPAEFLALHDSTLQPLYREYSRRFWDMQRTGLAEDAAALMEAKERYLNVYSDRTDFERLKAWRAEAPPLDPLTARYLERVYLNYLPYQLDPSVLSEIVRRETEIENAFNTFRPELDGAKVSDNAIRDVLRAESDASLRRRAWEASKEVGAAVAGDLVALVELRNREARRLGYRDYYGLMLQVQELDEGWLFALLDELESASEAAFVDMKRSLDAGLKKRYAIADSRSHPWLYGDPFFQELPSAGITEKLDAIFSGRSIEELTREHFRSLGMEIDDLVERADLYERDGKCQHAFCMDMDREGDVRVLANVRPDERWMSTMLHEFGHAVYDKYNDRELPFSLREPAHILATEAIAMLNGRMTKRPAWLMRFTGLSRAEADAIGEAAFQGARSSMLIFLRWALTLVRFERELYRDPRQPLNRLWWELVERIQKISPPPGRDRPDWASKIHLSTNPAYYQNYILGELMASQLQSRIERDAAGPEDIFTPAAGEYLVERVFKPGARWHWNEMLERATGEALTASHFLAEYRIA